MARVAGEEASIRETTSPARRPLSTTERNWFKALALVVLATLIAAGIQALENRFGHSDHSSRLIWNPGETAMRFVSLPHFLIAILFMSTSRSMRTPGRWVWLAGYSLLGVGLCWLFHRAGGRGTALPNALFLAYFLVHEFRDEAFFYRANGDAPPGSETKRERRAILAVPALGLLGILVVFLFGAAFRIGGTRRYTEAVYGWAPDGVRYAVGALVLAAFVGVVHFARRNVARGRDGGLRAFVRANRPVLVVFGGILAVLLLDILLAGRAYAIVLLHVSAWYVFVSHGLASRPQPDPAPRRFTWGWIRTTAGGFQFLHNTTVALIVGLAVLWAYGFSNDGSMHGFWLLLSKDAFPYWTIMHVTMSWTPK